jgi:hypothetical protein
MSSDPRLDAFLARVKQPYVWQHTAREYVVAANYLLDWHDVTRGMPEAKDFRFTLGGPAPVMVLYAIAAENLLKAIRVAKGEDPVVGDSLSSHFKHHKLSSHAQQGQVALTPEQTDLLEHLSDFMEAGRYPVPVTSGGTPRAWRFDYPADIKRVWALLERLEDDLRATGADVLPPMSLRTRYRPPGYELM